MTYSPTYIYGKEEALSIRREIDRKVEEILAKAKEARVSSVYQKCIWLHNYLVRHCSGDLEAAQRLDEYNMQRKAYKDAEKDGNAEQMDKPLKPVEALGAYSIEGPLLRGKAMCLGIARVFSYLAKKMGIDSEIVSGMSLRPGQSKYEKHAWNIVWANGEAAQIDVTWDMCVTEPELPVRYDYFFLPDIEMMRDHQYVGTHYCRPLKASYFDRTGTLLEDKCELDRYIRKVLRGEKDRCLPGEYLLYFKMKKRKETLNELNNYIGSVIRECTSKGFCWVVYPNEAQTTYMCKVKIEN